MQFSRQCNNCTDWYGSTNYPVSCSDVFAQAIVNFKKFGATFLPWYRVCTNAMFILKGSYGCGEPKNSIFQSMQKPHRPVRVNKLAPVSCSAVFGKQQKIFKISGLLYTRWYRVCTNATFTLKGSYGCGEPINAISQSVQKPHRPVRVNKIPHVPCSAVLCQQ